MKIMLVISGLGMGGAERVVTTLADKFALAGHEVLLVALGGKDVLLPSVGRVSVVNIGMQKSVSGVFRGFRRLRELITTFKPAVVHTHMLHANLMIRFMRSVVHIDRLITTVHCTNEGGRALMALYRLTDGFADVSTNVSDEAVAAFRRQGAFPPGRMITIYNGIATELFSYSPSARTDMRQKLRIDDDCFLFLAVGRLEYQKDYPNMIEALRSMPADASWRLAIAGEGVLRASLEQQVRGSRLEDKVCFLGLRTDIPALMSAADAVVLSSKFEGFPMVVGEAMACERVVVATDCGGVSEFLGELRQFLVPPGTPGLLADAMQRALCTPKFDRAQFGREARDRVIRNFSIDAAVRRWLDLYRVVEPASKMGERVNG